MTQLIINGVYLPEATGDKYQCYPEEAGENVDMISTRRVKEIRGHVQKIIYSFDYMGMELGRQVLEALRSSSALQVTYLPDGSDTMATGKFQVESLTNPTFAFSRNGEAYWHNIAFTLREVKSHD